jgi:hypothetical protein
MSFYGKFKYCVRAEREELWAKENGTRVEILPFFSRKKFGKKLEFFS